MKTIPLGFEIGSGRAVDIPNDGHLAITGQTQRSGKTTTLEALVARGEMAAIAFVTKRGEGSFGEGRRVAPYFRDRADWQFVTSIIDATLQEKNKFLRPWIIKICRTTKTLADVQARVREALVKAKGINEGVYTQLDAYLDLIVPEIARARLAEALHIRPGLNVMDVSGFAVPMQMLFVQSAIDWVNANSTKTIVIVPEAWQFIPQGKGSPVKASAVTLVRQGAGIGNFIWVDSQDMAGVDKEILRGCGVWLIGVQREANEIKRNLANIPKSIKHPSAADVAMLGKGQFYACWAQHCIKAYVQPAWMAAGEARDIAIGKQPVPAGDIKWMEDQVNRQEADELQNENTALRRRIGALETQIAELTKKPAKAPADFAEAGERPRAIAAPQPAPMLGAQEEATYQWIKNRLAEEAPMLLRVLAQRPELEVEIERKVATIDGASLKGRIARLIAGKFFDDGKTQGAARSELKRTGADVNQGNLWRALNDFLSDGFLSRGSGDAYVAVAGMKVNIVEK